MKTLLQTVLIALLCSATAQAEFIVDDFSHAVTVLAGPTTQPGFAVSSGTRDTELFLGADIEFGAGTFRLNTSGLIAPSVTLDYTLSSILNLSGVGSHTNPLLNLDLFGSVIQDYSVSVEISSTTTATSHTFASVPIVSGGVGPVWFDGTTAPVALASTVDGIEVTISRTNGGGFGTFDQVGTAKISAVPEPASFVLLGLTGIGGVLVMRRRRKNQKAA